MQGGELLLTIDGLRALRRAAAAGEDLPAMAARFDATTHDTNRALDALVGRTPAEALAALKRHRPPRTARTAPVLRGATAALKAFIGEVFGHG